MIASAVKEKKVQTKNCDKMLKSVELEFAGPVMKASRSIAGWVSSGI